MKKNAIRILSLLLVVMTLVGAISLPVSAYSYPMNYTITYKTKDGKTLGTNSGQVDAEATVREALRVTSPSYDGYVLSDSNDSVVTGKMISWRFPASNYVRHGSGSYTVYYEKACKMVVHYVYGASRRTATVDKTAYGKRGSSYTIYSPTISGYTPSKSSVSGSFSSESSSATVYYYESTYTISFNANGGSGAPSSITKKHFTNATLPSDKPYRTGYTFKGWGTSSSTSYAAYQPGSTFYTNANTTLYAVWSARTYNGGYIVVNEGVNLEELLKGAEEERRIHEEAMKSNTRPTPDVQNLITGRYFFPLTFDLVPFNKNGDLDWSDIYEDAGDEYADGYESEIQEAFDEYTADDDCDMIEYYDRNASARDKIVSAKWGFEEIGGKHFGVVDVQLTDPLTDEEEADFKDWISGQNSDGLGEGFEQHEINTDDGLLSVHFWNPDDDYYVDNEEEFRDRMNLGMGGIS